MGYIKNSLMICMLFNLSNAVNVVKNTFIPNGTKTSCVNNGEKSYFNLKGSWENTVFDEIYRSLNLWSSLKIFVR